MHGTRPGMATATRPKFRPIRNGNLDAQVKEAARLKVNAWAVYERLKADLPPMAPAEYERRCRELAKNLGI